MSTACGAFSGPLQDFALAPFTNSLAERVLRMMVEAMMRISGACRTFAEASAFATLRSVGSTAL
jgi:hypothetical protein